MLPGLTSFVQELLWAEAQQEARHLHLYQLPWWRSPRGAWWACLPPQDPC